MKGRFPEAETFLWAMCWKMKRISKAKGGTDHRTWELERASEPAGQSLHPGLGAGAMSPRTHISGSDPGDLPSLGRLDAASGVHSYGSPLPGR